MRIQHNVMAMNAYRNYSNNTSALSKNLEKLSSGYKINRAGDDAAGLAISEKMRAQITGLEVAQKNAKDGISLVQTAEGALTEVHDMLNRMVELADQSANGTYDDATDRTQLQKEINNLMTEIDRIADSANFNGIKLLDGSMSGASNATFTEATSLAAATFKLSITATGKDLVGGSIQIGNKTIQVKGANADGHSVSSAKALLSGSTLYVGESATASTIVSAIASYFGGAFTMVDADGTEYAVTAAASGGAIKFTVTRSTGITLKLNTLPTFTVNSGLRLQIGDTSDSFNQMKVGINDMHTDAMQLDGVDISTQEGAEKAIDRIRYAINYVSDVRGTLGATQNRLDHTINNLSVMQENIQDAESTIRDTDVAEEMMAYTKNNILVQSAQAMLAQANQVPQGVLQLLQ